MIFIFYNIAFKTFSIMYGYSVRSSPSSAFICSRWDETRNLVKANLNLEMYSAGTWYSTGTMETENDNIEIFSKYKREENWKNSYMSVPSFSFVAWCIMLVNNGSRKRLYHPFKNTTSIYIFKHNFCNLICNKEADLRSTCVSVVLYRMYLTDLYMYFAVKDKTICEAGLKDPM